MAAPSAAARAIASVAKGIGNGSSLLPIVGDALGAALGGSRVTTNTTQANNLSLAVNPVIGVTVGPGSSFSAMPTGNASGAASAPLSATQTEGGLPSTYGGSYGYGSSGYLPLSASSQPGILDRLLSNPLLLIALVGGGAYLLTQR
jgi:hypothetical protein